MKTKSFFLTIILFTFLLFFTSCEDKNEGNGEIPKPPVGNEENATVNEWIYKEMSDFYYWNAEMPVSTSMNYNLDPHYFFYRLLYQYNTRYGDRFSYLKKGGVLYVNPEIQSARAAVANELGFEYYTLHIEDFILYCVVYVKKGTNAAKTGLKRGDLIYEVNGLKITDANWNSLLSDGKSQYKLKIANRDDISEMTVNTAKDYNESPVFYNDIIEIGDKKIGYIVYNFFANGNNDNSMEYAVKMNNIFNKFKTANINELVLDLRYNPGGLVHSGTYIASAIVPNRGTGAKKIYTTREFNKTYDATLKESPYYEELVTEFFSDYITGLEVARLEMPRLYIITSRYTASASEQIINGLNPYIDVQIVGETTTGKNMESFAIKNEKNKDMTWILHPLTSKSFNSIGFSEYQSGFEPTVPSKGEQLDEFEFHEDENGNPALYPLGNPNEYLLSKAIEHMTGRRSRTTKSSEKTIGAKTLGSSIEFKSNNMIIERDK